MAISYINVVTPTGAADARQAVKTVIEALGIGHVDTLKRVLAATTEEERQRAWDDNQKFLAAMADLTSIELYLMGREKLDHKAPL